MDAQTPLQRWPPEVRDQLLAPFPPDTLEIRAGSKGQQNQAQALAYIDRTDVQERLDAVVGTDGWEFYYTVALYDPQRGVCGVNGLLKVLGVTKCDAGEATASASGGGMNEVLKAAVSDAFKRCADHFGIGRFLRRLPRLWLPANERGFFGREAYDQFRRQVNVEDAAKAAGWKGSYPDGYSAAPPPRQQYATQQTPSARSGREGVSIPDAVDGAVSERPICDSCGAFITDGAVALSTRKFGIPLCPGCQKRTAAA